MRRNVDRGACYIGIGLRCSLAAVSLALLAWYAPAQTPQLHPRSHEEREAQFRAAHHAILNVKVTDGSGNPISGLTSSNFVLMDNGQPRTISSLRYIEHGSPAASPRVILLLDLLNQSNHEFAEDVSGVRKFLTGNGAQLQVPIAIAVLSGAGLDTGDISQDRDSVLQQLDSMTRGVKAPRCEDLTEIPLLSSNVWTDRTAIQALRDQAPMCLNAKFTLSVTSLERLALKEEDTPGRVVLVWIGPGWPRLDGKQFVPDTPAIKENFFEHLVLLTTAMREGQVTLDSVSDLHHGPRQQDHAAPPAGVASADDMTAASLSLQALVHQSGGQTQDDAQGIPGAIARCLQDAEFFYALSFDFSAPRVQHEFHQLRINVNRPGANARTNAVYYAEP